MCACGCGNCNTLSGALAGAFLDGPADDASSIIGAIGKGANGIVNGYAQAKSNAISDIVVKSVVAVGAVAVAIIIARKL